MKYDVPRKGYPHSYRISEIEHEGELSAVEVGYTRVPPGITQILKRDVYAVHYITSGKGVMDGCELSGGKGYVLAPGERGITYADENTPYEAYWVLFRGSGARDIMKKCSLPVHNGIFRFKKQELCVDLIRNALFHIEFANKWEESFFLQSTLYRILSLHMCAAKEDKSEISSAAARIKTLIDCEYYEDLKIEVLARQMNYSESYLYKVFKATYGFSPQEYLLYVRIERAKALLLDKAKSYSINEVAQMVGIHNPLYFSRLFHRKTGLAPCAFRNGEDKI